MREFKIMAIFILCMTTLLGCSNNRQSFGEQGEYGIVSSTDRIHLQDTLTLADFKAFAENVTNKMMRSTVVRGWSPKRPKIILGDIENNTYRENLRIEDVYDQIEEVVLNSGLVRIVGKSSIDFEYIVKITMTENSQRNGRGQKLVSYTLQFTMHTLDDELVGRWSDDLSIAKAAKPLF